MARDLPTCNTQARRPDEAFAAGEVDISMGFIAPFIIHLEAGTPIVLLGGVHVGCFELFGTDQVHAIRDLKGKTVSIPVVGVGALRFPRQHGVLCRPEPPERHQFGHVSLAESIQLLAERKIDALMGFPPVPQELRAKQVGHVVVSSG